MAAIDHAFDDAIGVLPGFVGIVKENRVFAFNDGEPRPIPDDFVIASKSDIAKSELPMTR